MTAPTHAPGRRCRRLPAAVAGILAIWACSGGEPLPSPVEAPAAAAGAPAPPLQRPVLGVAINVHHVADLPAYLASVDQIADLEANTLLVVTPMFQRRADSSTIRYVAERCPTDEQLLAILRRARARGLQTVLTPIVLIERPREKDWRGVIRPDDPDAWWASYDRLLDRFLAIATAADVDAFSVGSELNSMEDRLDRWRRVVDRARAEFDGLVTYTANWDRYERVDLWPWLDFISISAYFELARDDPDAPQRRLERAWARHRDRIIRFASRHGRPFLLMELGYPSLPWAAAHPWNYVANGAGADHEAQARCYRAFFAAWSEAFARLDGPALGVHCYSWDPDKRGDRTDTGYGLRGKPARAIIAESFGRIRDAATGSGS